MVCKIEKRKVLITKLTEEEKKAFFQNTIVDLHKCPLFIKNRISKLKEQKKNEEDIQNVIDEIVRSEGLNCLNKIQFKNASLIFSYIKKSSGKTFIKDEPYFEFYKRDNKVYAKTFKGEQLKSPMLIKTNLNKLADFHELDEIESD